MFWHTLNRMFLLNFWVEAQNHRGRLNQLGGETSYCPESFFSRSCCGPPRCDGGPLLRRGRPALDRLAAPTLIRRPPQLFPAHFRFVSFGSFRRAVPTKLASIAAGDHGSGMTGFVRQQSASPWRFLSPQGPQLARPVEDGAGAKTRVVGAFFSTVPNPLAEVRGSRAGGKP